MLEYLKDTKFFFGLDEIYVGITLPKQRKNTIISQDTINMKKVRQMSALELYQSFQWVSGLLEISLLWLTATLYLYLCLCSCIYILDFPITFL